MYCHKWLNNGTKNWKWVLSVVIEHNSYFLLHSYSQVSLGVLAPIWHLKRCVFFCRILSSFQPESVPGMILLHPMVSLNQTLPVKVFMSSECVSTICKIDVIIKSSVGSIMNKVKLTTFHVPSQC